MVTSSLNQSIARIPNLVILRKFPDFQQSEVGIHILLDVCRLLNGKISMATIGSTCFTIWKILNLKSNPEFPGSILNAVRFSE
jgi:hypothetical protein